VLIHNKKLKILWVTQPILTPQNPINLRGTNSQGLIARETVTKV
jgi:hypothetical protein